MSDAIPEFSPIPPEGLEIHGIIEKLLLDHESRYGPVALVEATQEGTPVFQGENRVATLVGEGDSSAVEALALAVGAVFDLLDSERRRQRVLADRLGALAMRLARAEEELAGPMQRRTEDLRRQREQLEQAAMTDALTGVFNRRAIEIRLREAAALSQNDEEPLTVLMVDIDHFKQVNDNYGHLAGDQVLAYVGRCLGAKRRRHDVVGRWGGEEFLIALPGCPLEAATRISEEVRAAIEALTFEGTKAFGITVTASVGFAVGEVGEAELDDDSPEGGASRLVEAADNCLYEAKETGRNRVVGVRLGGS